MFFVHRDQVILGQIIHCDQAAGIATLVVKELEQFLFLAFIWDEFGITTGLVVELANHLEKDPNGAV